MTGIFLLDLENLYKSIYNLRLDVIKSRLYYSMDLYLSHLHVTLSFLVTLNSADTRIFLVLLVIICTFRSTINFNPISINIMTIEDSEKIGLDRKRGIPIGVFLTERKHKQLRRWNDGGVLRGGQSGGHFRWRYINIYQAIRLINEDDKV